MTRTEILADYKRFFEMEHLMITEYDELIIDWAEQLVKNCNIPCVSNSVCEHDYVYKILHDHTAVDVCTKCGNIKKQTDC